MNEGNPYWPDPRGGIVNPTGNFPYPLQPNQPLVHYSTFGDSMSPWINTGTAWRAQWNGPLIDLRAEWKPSDAFQTVAVSSPAVGAYGNGRSLSVQFTGRLATVAWLQAFYYYDGAVSNSNPEAIGRLSQPVSVIDQIILGGTNSAVGGTVPEGMSVVTLVPPASVRFWKPYIFLELPVATVPPFPAIRVAAAFN